MRSVISIEPKWLSELAPHYYSDADFKDEKKPRLKE